MILNGCQYNDNNEKIMCGNVMLLRRSKECLEQIKTQMRFPQVDKSCSLYFIKQFLN